MDCIVHGVAMSQTQLSNFLYWLLTHTRTHTHTHTSSTTAEMTLSPRQLLEKGVAHSRRGIQARIKTWCERPPSAPAWGAGPAGRGLPGGGA